jgi:hypothetical protein
LFLSTISALRFGKSQLCYVFFTSTDKGYLTIINRKFIICFCYHLLIVISLRGLKIRTSKGQNIKSIFRMIRTLKIRTLKIRTSKIRTSKIRMFKRTSKVKNDFWHSDFTYGIRKDQNVENWKDQVPMAYYLCVPRHVGT